MPLDRNAGTRVRRSEEPETGLTDEQIARLPYNSESPADASDVVAEVRRLVVLVGSLAAAVGDPVRLSAMLEDATKDPGQAVLVQETRVALALESWATELGTDVVETVMQALTQAAEEVDDASGE